MCKNIPFSSSNSRSQYQHQGRITCEWVRDTIQPQKDCRLHSYSSFWPLRVSFLRGSSKLPLDHVPRFHRIVCLLHTGRGVLLLVRHAAKVIAERMVLRIGTRGRRKSFPSVCSHFKARSMLLSPLLQAFFFASCLQCIPQHFSLHFSHFQLVLANV